MLEKTKMDTIILQDTSEAVPSMNFIGRQLDVYYIGRQMYGEISFTHT